MSSALRFEWPPVATAPTAPSASTASVSEAQRLESHATALFDELLESMAPGTAELGHFPRLGEIATARFEEAFADATVVSFDIFDTLIVRKVAAPSDVFLHLAGLVPFAALGIEAGELAQARQRAEHTARVTALAVRGSSEVTLHEIHGALATQLELDQSAVAEMVRSERLVEQALCVAHPTVSGWFARARAEGKQLWCVSDTYHEAEFLSSLLTGCGYDLTDVQVVSSAESRCSKGDGRLLPKIAAAQGVEAYDVLHIGDHPQSDDEIPAALGFLTLRHPWAAARASDAPATAAGDSVALGLAMIAARTVEPPVPFWWRFGYATVGPLLAGFACWLHSRFQRDGITRAYFLLRDGEIIEEVYRALFEGRPGPTTALLESSRRAFAMPAMESGKASLLAQLTATENDRPAGEFLERMGVRAHDHLADFAAVGLTSPDEVISPHDGAQLSRVASLLARPAVSRALVARSREERRLLMNFLDAQGVTAPGRVALVDIGWNATIQRSLTSVLELERRTLSVHGYYLGALRGAKQEMAESSTVSGYLFSGGEPTHRVQPVMALRQLIEFICTTARGSLRGFRWNAAGEAEPIHAEAEHDTAQQAAHAQLKAGVLAYVSALVDERRLFGFDAISPDAAMRPLARTIQHPTPEEAQQIGDLRYGEGLGSDRSRALAAFDPDAWSREQLLDNLRTSYWPIGLLARRDPKALLLRTVHWLGAEHAL
jgi:predicted HAD superfamily hydrolase